MRRKKRSNRAISRAIFAVCERLEVRQLLSSTAFNSVLAFPAEPVNPTNGTFITNSSVHIAVAQLNPASSVEDVVTADSDGTVNILYGNGDGTFQAPVTIGNVGRAYCVAVADVKGDGEPYIFVGSSDYYLRVFVNTDGTFSSSDEYSISLHGSPTSLAVGDFYSDAPDRQGVLAATTYNNGDGRYSYLNLITAHTSTSIFGPSPSGSTYSIATGHLEGNGTPDDAVLVSSAGGSNDVKSF